MAVEPDAIRRGTVVVVRLSRDKARPAVVIRSNLLSELSHATVLPITTELRANVSMRIDIEPGPDMATMAAITRQMAVVLGIGSGTGRSRRPRTI
jgi:mRNA-degrading endonuclease toxin of MazEF toxin-antitoxin module